MPFAVPKISLVPHGVDSAFGDIARRRTAGRATTGAHPFLLTVATLHPHKNLDRLIQAFAAFRVNRPDYRLVIAGLRGFAAASIESLIRTLNLSDAVELTGWIAQAELYKLFEFADAFVAPSLFEGFGLTLAEALAAGIPTAYADIPVFHSLAGASALRFDPHSVPAITAAMDQVTGDESFRSFARTAGPAQVESLRWTRTAALTLEEFVNAAGSNHKDYRSTRWSAQPPPAR
jgi:alpha-1,3-rhamnosyl/mannosyltransferase